MGTDSLLIASRGANREHGLVRCRNDNGTWMVEPLAPVDQLSSLAWHPRLPVVYGTAGVGEPGRVVAIEVESDRGHVLSNELAGPTEFEPCHVAVDPTGALVMVTNYTSGQLACWPLSTDGSLIGTGQRLQLLGSGPDPQRQDGAHPHQAVFQSGTGADRVWIVDLGADLIREFHVRVAGEQVELIQLRELPTPAGSGPRHLVELPDGRLAISGELGSNLLVLNPADGSVQDVASTTRTGPARTRHSRNYPGDIQRSADGKYVYFANRGYDTISMFDVSGEIPVLITEQDAGVQWPQHILVREHDILVAGWDSSEVVSLATGDDGLGNAEAMVSVAAPGWILPDRF